MELIGDTGVTVIWVGEHGVRYYAHGRALNSHSSLLEKQAKMVTNTKLHLAAAKKMYEMRFKNEDVSGLTMQQLRGREGSRMRRVYREQSKKWGIPWHGRNYVFDDFESGDPVNQALSAGNACLYGLATAVICALGCSPALGFVHVGHELSFSYDIGDLYKADITIPLAFQIASETTADIANVTRRRIWDIFAKDHCLERMVRDIKYILSEDGEITEENALYLWDNLGEKAEHGISYGKGDDEDW